MTPSQLESIRAARLQLIDLGDEKTARTLDWVLIVDQPGYFSEARPSDLPADVKAFREQMQRLGQTKPKAFETINYQALAAAQLRGEITSDQIAEIIHRAVGYEPPKES